MLLTDPGDEPPPDDNPPANEEPPPPEDMQPPAGTDPAQEPPGDNLSPHIIQLGSDGQEKLIEWTQTTRDLIVGLFREDVDSLVGEINQTAGIALTGMNGLAPSLEFLSQTTLPGNLSNDRTLTFDPDAIAQTLKNSLPQFAVLGTVVPDHGSQEDPGTGTISAMTPFGPYSVNLFDGTRHLDATYEYSPPSQPGIDVDRTTVSMNWMDGDIEWLMIDFDREFQGNGQSRRFQYHYSGASYSPAIHSGSITFDDGLHSGGTSFVASGGAVTSSQT